MQRRFELRMVNGDVPELYTIDVANERVQSIAPNDMTGKRGLKKRAYP
jgi:hypothetical protein